MKMNKWKIKDMIKKRQITFKNGDEVIVFRRKKNGYPRGLKDGVTYIVFQILNDVVILKGDTIDSKLKKVHNTYIIGKSELRDLKIESILYD